MNPNDAHGLLPDSLRRAAAADPHAPAVVGETWTVSDAMLHTAACGLATQLAALAPAGPVAALMPKSALAVAALHGVLLSGRAYLPVDPATPVQRLATLLRDARAAALLVDASVPPPPGLRRRLPLPCIALDESIFVANPTVPPSTRIDDNTPACLPASAGPGGKPQEAVIRHGTLRAHAATAVTTFRLTPRDRLAGPAPFDQDLHFFDLYTACAVGAAVVLLPPPLAEDGHALLQFVARRQVSVWHAPAAALVLLAQALGGIERQRLSDLRALLCAREKPPAPALLRWLRACPWARVYNQRGGAEAYRAMAWDLHALQRRFEATTSP